MSLHPCPFTASAPGRCRYLVFCVAVSPKSAPLTWMAYSCMKDVLWKLGGCVGGSGVLWLIATDSCLFCKDCSRTLLPDCFQKGVCVYLNITQIRKGAVLSLGFCYVSSKPNLFIIGNPSEQPLCLSQSVLVLQPGFTGISIGFLWACSWQLLVVGSVLLQSKQCNLYKWVTFCFITESSLSQFNTFMGLLFIWIWEMVLEDLTLLVF